MQNQVLAQRRRQGCASTAGFDVHGQASNGIVIVRQLLAWPSSSRAIGRRQTPGMANAGVHTLVDLQVPIDTYFIDSKSAAFLQAKRDLSCSGG